MDVGLALLWPQVYENNGPWSRLAYSPDDSYNTRPAFLSGGGGLVSTASDYMRFCLLLANKGRDHWPRAKGEGST